MDNIDRIEILSHGGLTNGQSKEQFFNSVSCPVIVSKYGQEAFEITNKYMHT